MRAWTVDADDIRVAEDFDEALLHRTPEIDGFLSIERDDKFIVIGTKGFGKTLLLKAKLRNTQALEGLISKLRSIDGVERTETSVALSTKVERTSVASVALDLPARGQATLVPA